MHAKKTGEHVVLIEEPERDDAVGGALSSALTSAGFTVVYGADNAAAAGEPDVVIRVGRRNRSQSGFADVAPAERELFENRIRHAEKMESVALLAGGIAHDFNNILSVISICSDEVLETMPPDSPARECIVDIRHAVERGATLTRDLLSFSRRDVNEPRLLDLNDLVDDCRRMVARIVGDGIRIETELAAIDAMVRIDATQWASVFVNLSLNARHAMPGGGSLTFRTSDVVIEPKSRGFDRPRGAYVELLVHDTGDGIPPAILPRIFDPFFTTREVGQGTGLGLSVVHGIIEQARGFIDVKSETGRGTTFSIYVPVAGDEPGPEPLPALAAAIDAVVLLVEDEDAIRRSARRALERQGYTVVEASSAEEALELLPSIGRLDVVVTDVVLPRLNGRELAERVRARHPQVHVLYTSGYSDDPELDRARRAGSAPFLQKPFTTRLLLRRVQELVEGDRGAPQS